MQYFFQISLTKWLPSKVATLSKIIFGTKDIEKTVDWSYRRNITELPNDAFYVKLSLHRTKSTAALIWRLAPVSNCKLWNMQSVVRLSCSCFAEVKIIDNSGVIRWMSCLGNCVRFYNVKLDYMLRKGSIQKPNSISFKIQLILLWQLLEQRPGIIAMCYCHIFEL